MDDGFPDLPQYSVFGDNYRSKYLLLVVQESNHFVASLTIIRIADLIFSGRVGHAVMI